MILFDHFWLLSRKELSFTLNKTAYRVSYVTYYDNEIKYCFESENNESLTAKTYYGKGNSMLDSDTAYIAFAGFEGRADVQMINALAKMKERGRTKLILDLRGNGGGRMDILTEIAGALIYCNGKNNFAVAIAEGTRDKSTFYSGKNRYNTAITSISVLADKHSASASECLIGAMIHYGGAFSRDKLIIEKDESGKATTYGKGIMQTTYGLIGGGALKLTTARMLWPDGTTCIHGKGITAKAENQVEKDQVLSRALEVL
jgi:C-terminal processing protease CtpA/Prc